MKRLRKVQRRQAHGRVPPSVASRRRGSGWLALVALDQRVGRVVVDRLEILRLDDVGVDAAFRVQQAGDVAHHVLDELRIVIGALRYVLLVRALEQTIDLARGLAFDQLYRVLDPQVVVEHGRHGDVRALVVRAVSGDLLRAGTQAGHRHHELHGKDVVAALADFTDEGDLVVHQAPDAGNRCGLVDEIGEGHLDVAGLRLEALDHLAQHRFEGLDRDLALVAVEDLDDARHVGALELVGQADVYVEAGDGVLHATALVDDFHRVAYRLDTDLVDRDLPAVRAVLHVGHRAGHGGVHGRALSFVRKITPRIVTFPTKLLNY